MNSLQASISKIEQVDSLSIVTFDVKSESLRMMSLGIDDALVVGATVTLGVKSSSIALAKELQGMISLSNRLACQVLELKEGQLLSRVKLDFKGTILESIITTASAKRMQLREGESVEALIKASELSILQVHDQGSADG